MLGSTVEELQERITADEFIHWAAFYELEPWGFHSDNWRMSMLAATTANYSGNAKNTLRPSDFLPRRRGSTKPRQTAREIKQAFRSIAGSGDSHHDD